MTQRRASVIYGDGIAVDILRDMVGASASLAGFLQRRGCALVGVDVPAVSSEQLTQAVEEAMQTLPRVPDDVTALVIAGIAGVATDLRGLGMRIPHGHLVGFLALGGRTLVANVGHDVLDVALHDDVQVWLTRAIDEVVGPALGD